MEEKIIPLARAGEMLGINDLEKLNKAATRYGADVLIAGSLLYVNVEIFKNGVQAEIAAKASKADNRAATKGEAGRSIGLLRARIKRAPELIAKKTKAIEAAKQKVTASATAYDRFVAKRELVNLETGLARLQDGLVNDENMLGQILAEEPGE